MLADDPLLTVRLAGLEHRSPPRVVLDSRLRIPLTSRLVAGATEIPTWIIATLTAPAEAEQALVERGAEVLRVGADPAGRPNLPDAMRLLGTRGLTRLFCEGGPELAEALALAGLLDEVCLVTSSVTSGGDVPALRPGLSATLGALRASGEEAVGADHFAFYERP